MFYQRNEYKVVHNEPLPGVLGNKGTGAFIFTVHGILSN